MDEKPSLKEEEYFARQEMERKRKHQEELAAKMAAAERAERQRMHHMKCPKCGMDLAELEFRGVKIDRCFSCHGVWLDNGELENLMAQEHGFLKRFFG